MCSLCLERMSWAWVPSSIAGHLRGRYFIALVPLVRSTKKFVPAELFRETNRLFVRTFQRKAKCIIINHKQLRSMGLNWAQRIEAKSCLWWRRQVAQIIPGLHKYQSPLSSGLHKLRFLRLPSHGTYEYHLTVFPSPMTWASFVWTRGRRVRKMFVSTTSILFPSPLGGTSELHRERNVFACCS